MPCDIAVIDAFCKVLGFSQEYLDTVHKGAEEYRAVLAARKPLPSCNEAEVDTDIESDDDEAALPTPPTTPGWKGSAYLGESEEHPLPSYDEVEVDTDIESIDEEAAFLTPTIAPGRKGLCASRDGEYRHALDETVQVVELPKSRRDSFEEWQSQILDGGPHRRILRLRSSRHMTSCPRRPKSCGRYPNGIIERPMPSSNVPGTQPSREDVNTASLPGISSRATPTSRLCTKTHTFSRQGRQCRTGRVRKRQL